MRLDPVLDALYVLGTLWGAAASPRVCPAGPQISVSSTFEAAWSSGPAAAGVTAFVDVSVVPMDSERVLPNHTVLVEGGRIIALGPSAKAEVPANAVRIDGRGKYLVPGLADMHVHLDHYLAGLDTARYERRLFNFLAYGVTTIRNMDNGASSGEHRWLHLERRWLHLKARAAAGTLLSPRIYTSGGWAPVQYVDSSSNQLGGRAGPPPRLDSVAAYVAAYQALGYDHIKPYFEQRPVFDSLLAAARRLGMPIAGHVPRPWAASAPVDTTLSLELVLASGAYRSIEHLMGYWDYNPPPGLPRLDEAKLSTQITATVRAGVWNTPTLAITERDRLHPKIGTLRRAELEEKQKIVRALHAAGAGLLVGSDMGDVVSGLASPSLVHDELAALVGAGLSPYEALRAGTSNPAAYFRTLDSMGTIAVGKRADLVLLAGNPLQDIRHTRELAGVMVGGRWLAREAIDRRLGAP